MSTDVIAVERSLSAREREVIQLVANGLSNRQIGKKLYLSEETIKTHMRKVIMKLLATNRAHAVAIAIRKGLID